MSITVRKWRLALPLLCCLATAGLLLSACEEKKPEQPVDKTVQATIDKLIDEGVVFANEPDTLRARQVLDSAITLAHQSGYVKGEGVAHLSLSMMHFNMGHNDSCERETQRALEVFRKGNYKGKSYMTARIYQIDLLYNDGNNVRVAKEGLQVLQEATELKDTVSMTQISITLSNAMELLQESNKSVEYAERAVALIRGLGTEKKYRILVQAWLNLATVYNHVDRYAEALHAAHEAEKLSWIPEFDQINVSTCLGESYLGLNNIDSAEYHYNRAATLNEKFGAATDLDNISGGLIRINMRRSNYAKALRLADERLAEAITSGDTGINLQYLHSSRAQALEHLGRYQEALQAYHQHDTFAARALAKETRQQIATAESRFRLREKESEINQLATTSALRKKWLIGVLVALALALAATTAAIVQYRRQRRATKIISDQAERLQWLMKEIHHRIKNNLHVIISLINMQLRQAKNEAAEALLNDTVGRILSIAVVHQRLYQHEDLEVVELSKYLTQLGSAILEVNGPATLQVDAPVLLDTDTTIMLGLIVTELITNSCKHARLPDRTLSITLSVLQESADNYVLRYQDNGPGISDAQPKKETLGTRIVSLMAKQMSGSIEWGAGTGMSLSIRFTGEKTRRAMA